MIHLAAQTDPVPGFALWDYGVVLGYFALLAGTGWWFSRVKQRSATDYFLGGRSMPTWAVGISLLATAQSAATFLGAPESAYRGNLTYISSTIGQFLAVIVIVLVFIPAFYKAKVGTVYELLEQRCGKTASKTASGLFILGRIFASGARLYLAALAFAMILSGTVEYRYVTLGIALMVVIGVGYTLVGGIRSVIFTDVIQAVVYLGAACVALFVIWRLIPGETGVMDLVKAMQSGMKDGGSKIQWIQAPVPGADDVTLTKFFSKDYTYTIWTAVICFTLFNIAAYGTDQDLAQRMLTCSSPIKGSWSVISAMLMGLPVTLLFLFVGIGLWVVYQQPDLMGDNALQAPEQSKKAFLVFIMTQMPVGLKGLLMAGVIAAGLSSLNSALNALASAMVGDFIRPIVNRFEMDRVKEETFVLFGRLGVVVFGVILGVVAILCMFWQSNTDIPLLDFALKVMIFAYGGLVGVYLCVLLCKRGSTVSATTGMITGFVIVVLLQDVIWVWLTSMVFGLFTDPKIYMTWGIVQFDLAWPWQITLSAGVAFVICLLGKGRRDDV